jgi:hypothetical protein
MCDTDRDIKGRFTHGHKVDLPRDSLGRFMRKSKEKSMVKRQDISMVEDRVDELLKKHGL